MRRDLSNFQFDPIQLERLMQGRGGDPEREARPLPPQDATLAEAVARFNSEAAERNRPDLVMSNEQWREMVLRHMVGTDPNAYVQEVMARIGPVSSLDEVNGWVGLANHIWNVTPQPDRGGKTAKELSGR